MSYRIEVSPEVQKEIKSLPGSVRAQRARFGPSREFSYRTVNGTTWSSRQGLEAYSKPLLTSGL